MIQRINEWPTVGPDSFASFVSSGAAGSRSNFFHSGFGVRLLHDPWGEALAKTVKSNIAQDHN